jgi:DNA-binding NarL/FixJ family response regulator
MSSGENAPQRILIVEDHLVVGEVLARRLRDEPGIVVHGVVSSWNELQAALETSPVDALLMDVVLGAENSLDFPPRLEAIMAGQAPRCVALTGQGKPLVVRQAIEHGFQGLILKTEPMEELMRVLREVLKGKTCYSAAALSLLVESRGRNPFSSLTTQEMEVLRLLVQGCSVKESATHLSVSENTVKTHRRHLMAKLGVHDSVRLTRLALEEGLILE